MVVYFEPKFKCGRCLQQFNYKIVFKQHMMIHTGEKHLNVMYATTYLVIRVILHVIFMFILVKNHTFV